MFAFYRLFCATLVSGLLASVFALADGSHAHRRSDVGRRHQAVNITQRDHRLSKRYDNAPFTNFEVGINACGGFDHRDDFIIALGIEQFENGKHCGDKVTLQYKGKTAVATVTDECENCYVGWIDLSPGLFDYLTEPGGYIAIGEVWGTWWWGADEQPKPDPTPTTTKKHTTSTHHDSPPTTSSTSKKHSSTHTSSKSTHASTSTTSEKHSSTTSSLERSTTPTPSITTSSAPTATVTSFDSGNINQLNLAMLQLIGLYEAEQASLTDA